MTVWHQDTNESGNVRHAYGLRLAVVEVEPGYWCASLKIDNRNKVVGTGRTAKEAAFRLKKRLMDLRGEMRNAVDALDSMT